MSDVSYTIHLAGVSHREAAERIADNIFDKFRMYRAFREGLEAAGRYVECNPVPVRPVVVHCDTEMDSTISSYHDLAALSGIIQQVCNDTPDISAIWWKVIQTEDDHFDEFELHVNFYSLLLGRVNTGWAALKCKPDEFDQELVFALNEQLAKVTQSQSARFDAERNIILLTPTPVEVPQCEWMDARVNPLFRNIISSFIPLKQASNG